MLRAALAPYAGVIRGAAVLLGALAIGFTLGFAVWKVALEPRFELAKLQKAHDRLLMELEGRNEAAVLARVDYDAEVMRLGLTRKKEIDDAFERGRVAAAGIAAGDIPVRVVWRDRCSAPAAGAGAEPDSRAAGVDQGRADAIGRVLGHGGAFDAQYHEAYARLTSAQKLLNQCYEEPAR